MAVNNVYDFVNAITYNKQDVLNDDSVKHYNSFVINRALSYHLDSVLYANDVNQYPDMPPRWQFDYLINSLRVKKRFAKWGKPVTQDNIKLVQNIYSCNVVRASEIVTLLDDQQLQELAALAQPGGRT